MRRVSVLDNQSVKRTRHRHFSPFKENMGQLGFGLLRIFLFFLGLGVLSLAFISGYQFLSSSSYLRLRTIVVTGVKAGLREELLKVSGITEKDTYLSINAAGIKRNIENHPWINSVRLRRKFPDTLYIDADREVARAVVLLEKLYLMNSEGVIFKACDESDHSDFPVITGLSPGAKENQSYLKVAASFLNILPSGGGLLSMKGLSEVHVEDDGALTIYFNAFPLKAFFGKDGFSKKINLLERITHHLQVARQLSQVTLIDLDFHDRGVVRFKERLIKG